MLKSKMLVYIILIAGFLIPRPAQAQTASSQQTLNQYVADLQSNPNDTALRENIIALAQTMSPPPEAPAEARRHMARGVAAVEDAKTPGDFKDACNEFQQAATLAPWLANAYRNLAIAQDKAGMYDDALGSIRFYLLAKPSTTDVNWAEDLKAKVEYRKEKAARAKYEPAAQPVVPQENSFEALLRKINGRRYTCHLSGPSGEITQVLDVRGDVFIRGSMDYRDPYGYRPQYHESDSTFFSSRIQILGRETTVVPIRVFAGIVSADYVISRDGSSIAERTHISDGSQHEFIYLWQR